MKTIRMKKHVQVSLVIPTYNRLMKLFQLLKSISRLNPLPDEVIIIDDHSKDQTPELLKSWNELENGICKKILLKSMNMGPAHSRNLGIEIASNKLVAFVDDDVVIKSDWVDRITSPLHETHKSLVGVGGAVRALKNHIISQYYVIHKILEAPIQLNYLPTVNCCFKKEHLMEVGGFDDNFLFAGGEDTDLCLRLKKKGYFFDKVQDAIVYHDFSPNFIDFCQTWLRYGKGTHLAIHNLRRNSHD